MIAALPMEAQEALQEMANGMTLEEVIDLVQKGEVDLEDIAGERRNFLFSLLSKLLIFYVRTSFFFLFFCLRMINFVI